MVVSVPRIPIVAVAARRSDRVHGDQHPRARVEAGLGGLAEAVVGPARVPHGGEALHEGLLHAAEGLGRDQAGRVVAVLLRDVALDRADVHVRVGEARHQGAAVEIDGVDLAQALATRAHAIGVVEREDVGVAHEGLADRISATLADLDVFLVVNTQSLPVMFPIPSVGGTWMRRTFTPTTDVSASIALSLQAFSSTGYQGTIYVDEIDIK